MKQLINFITTNSSLILFGAFNYYFLNKTNTFAFILLITLVKNYSLIGLIDYKLKNHPKIGGEKRIVPLPHYKGEFNIHVISSAIIEALFLKFIIKQLITSQQINLKLFLYFIPKSFLFEVIFDFFHYVTHYIAHHRFLYIYSHKLHHKFSHPSSITTYYQHPLDIIFTNGIPVTITLVLLTQFFQIDFFTFVLINIYKTYIEIAGHSGKVLNKTTSFPQFMWLPKFLNIELSTEDHDKHHSSNNCNYSKRFTLWDKVFGTYK